MGKLKSLLRDYKLTIFGSIGLIPIICLIICFGKNDFGRSYFTELSKVKIDTSYNSEKDSGICIENNKTILAVLQSREAILSNEVTAKNDDIWLIRSIFFAVLAGLFTLLFTNDQNNKTPIYIVIIVLILINYLFDVHLEDQFIRKKIEYSKTREAVESLLGSISNGAIYYNLDYVKFNKKLTEGFDANYNKERWKRKSINACRINKNMERMVYYIIPLIAALILLFHYRDRKKPQKLNN